MGCWADTWYENSFPVAIPTMSQALQVAFLGHGVLGHDLLHISTEPVMYTTEQTWLLRCLVPHPHMPPAGFLDVRAVPAINSAAEGGAMQVALWLVPLWLLCVAFWITAAWEARCHLKHYQGSQHWVTVSVRQPLSRRQVANLPGRLRV